MSPIVLDIRTADDQRDIVHRAVQALAEGKVVAMPTETVYGVAASALSGDAVAKLIEAKGRQQGHPMTLAVKNADDASDFVPDMPALGERLARRCWPGPLTLVFDNDHQGSAATRLPAEVQQAVSPSDTIGLRAPAHPFLLSVLNLCAGPLVLTSANLTGQPDATTAEEVAANLGDSVALIVDDGKSQFGQASSVVHVQGNHLKVLRSGVFNNTALKRLAGLTIVFVCTGNTCRSPMAEVLMRRRVAEKLGCDIDEVEEYGIQIASAGIAAMTGGRAADEAVNTVKQFDLDLRGHESQPLSAKLAEYADLIITMTRGHRQAIVTQWPGLASRVHVLCTDGSDVSDPIGGSAEVYQHCAAQIDEQLNEWMKQIDLDHLPEISGGQDA